MSFSVYNDKVTLSNRSSTLLLNTTTATISDSITTRRIIMAKTGQISIGTLTTLNEAENSISIGLMSQGGGGLNSICIGRNVNYNNAQNTICISFGAGQTNNGGDNICIGYQTGTDGSGGGAKKYSVSIGGSYIGCGEGTVAIGQDCSKYSPANNYSVCIGNSSGFTGQGINSIAIGYQAGYTNQGINSIAIGTYAGNTVQHVNSIILNATGSNFTTNIQGAFFVKPIRSVVGGTDNLLLWGETSGEIFQDNSAKTFIINHPLDKEKYLVHGCLEGPEAGVYYRGESEITNSESVEVSLPKYVKSFSDFTVQISPIYNGNINIYNSSEVIEGKFRVYGNSGKFYWFVHCLRQSVDVEPSKSGKQVNGEGPYVYVK